MSIVNYKKRNTRIITISLVVIVALSVVGPWNAISVGRYSQTNRLEKLLVENSMLLNGQIVKAGENISDEDKVQISTMLKFLENEYNYKGVEFIPENFTTKKMEEVMGFEYVYDYDYIRNPKEMGMVFIDEIMTGGIINISGYDYAWSTDGGSNSYIDTEKGKLEIEYIREQDGSHLNIELNNTIILKEYTHKYIEAIYNTWKEVGENITLEDMSFVTGTDEVDVKIVFTALEVYDDDESLESGWQKITVLVKFK